MRGPELCLGSDAHEAFRGEKLANVVECFMHVYSNVGLPNAMGGYDDTPKDMARGNRPFFENKWLNMVGGRERMAEHGWRSRMDG